MIGDIEHLRSELDIELLGDPLDREILQDREIRCEKVRPSDAIPQNVARGEISAVDPSGRRRCWSIREISALALEGGRSSRAGVAICIDPKGRSGQTIREAVVNWVTSGNLDQRTKLVRPGIA